MNKLKKMFVVATGTAVVAGLAFSVATQTADAVAKKYTVTVKYVGDDKKTLKTVKKTVKAGTKYKLAKLSSKDKATHNYAYKSGSKTIKVTKKATYTVTYKRTAYDIKFVSYKSDTGKTYATSKVINVKKGKSYTYQAPTTKGYNKPAKVSVKPTKDATYKVKATPAVTKYTVKIVAYTYMTNQWRDIDTQYVVKTLSLAKGATYTYKPTAPEGYEFDGKQPTFTGKVTGNITQKFYLVPKPGVVDGKYFYKFTKLADGRYSYVTSYKTANVQDPKPITYISKTKPAYWTWKSGVVDGKPFNGYTRVPDGKYYFSGFNGVFSSKTAPTVWLGEFLYDVVPTVINGKTYDSVQKMSNGQYLYSYWDNNGVEQFVVSSTKPVTSGKLFEASGVINGKYFGFYQPLSNGSYVYWVAGAAGAWDDPDYYVISSSKPATIVTYPKDGYSNTDTTINGVEYYYYFKLSNGQYAYSTSIDSLVDEWIPDGKIIVSSVAPAKN